MRLIALFAALLALGTPAAAAWHEASTEHFVIYSDDSEENIRRFATRLESFDKAVRKLRGWGDPPLGPANRVTVYTLPSVGQIGKLSGIRGAAGFYIPRAGGSVAFVPRYSGTGDFDLNATAVLLHEYSHHLMYTNFPNAAFPAWFSEGFAEFHAPTKFERNGDLVIGAPPMYRGYGLVTGNPLPVARLLGYTGGRLNDAQRDAIYGRGWLLTHFLTFTPARRPQLGDYIRRINQGAPPAEAATAFGDLKALGSELDSYLLKRRISAFPFAAKDLAIGPVAVRKLAAGEAAMMPVRIRSKRGVDAATAAEVVLDARKRAAPFANDVAVQIVLAEAEYDAGNLDLAEAAADRALAVNGKAVDALVYKGMARMARAVAAKDMSEATWKDVRRWFVAANRADPLDPEPQILFYSSFAAAGVKPNANAVIALEQAAGHAPQDRSLRLMLARQYLVDSKADLAKALLRPVAYDPHGGPRAEFAAAQIALIDKGDLAAALAAWKQTDEAEETG